MASKPQPFDGSEEVLRRQAALIDLTPSGILVRRLDGTITFWSKGAQTLYGWTKEEAIGQRTHALFKTVFPEPLERIVAKMRQAGQWTGELRHHTKDHRTVIVESWWRAQFTPAGEVAEIMEANIDITGRKQIEEQLRQSQAELERRVHERTAELAATNRELEAFAYSVSHDLRAPLRHMVSFAKMLEKEAGPALNEDSRGYARIITEAGARMEMLIDELLAFSRIGRATLKKTQINLPELLDRVRQELAPALEGRRIEWQVGPLPRAWADPTLLHSVLVNLLSNAIKFTRGRNPARIQIEGEDRDDETIFFVRDNGAGFDMRFVDKLFGVFQRLHRAQEFEGTGIGLASVRRIIQRHGGRTWAEGAPGQGATFYFSLPARRAGRAET